MGNIGLVSATVGTVVSLSQIALNYSSFPEKIPIQWKIDGSPGRMVPKTLVWLFPIMIIGTAAITEWAKRNPEKSNFIVTITDNNHMLQYQYLRTMLVGVEILLSVFLPICQFYAVQDDPQLPGSIINSFMVTLFGGIGLYYYKSWTNK